MPSHPAPQMAEREGFEPSIQVVPVYWFSKPAPSASRPPFRNPQTSLPPGGGGRIRTFGGREPSAVFKTAALSRSATPPESQTSASTASSATPRPAHIRHGSAAIKREALRRA